jgi:hypothetical protein
MVANPVASDDSARALDFAALEGVADGGVRQCGDGKISSLLRRAEAWGLTSVWIGAGAHPPARVADHLLWVDGVDPGGGGDVGRLRAAVPLVWELVHVVFEHPGLFAEPRGVGRTTTPVYEPVTCRRGGHVGTPPAHHHALTLRVRAVAKFVIGPVPKHRSILTRPGEG